MLSSCRGRTAGNSARSTDTTAYCGPAPVFFGSRLTNARRTLCSRISYSAFPFVFLSVDLYLFLRCRPHSSACSRGTADFHCRRGRGFLFEQEIDVRLDFSLFRKAKISLSSTSASFSVSSSGCAGSIVGKLLSRRAYVFSQSSPFRSGNRSFQQTAVFHAVLRVLTDQTVLEL